MSISLIAAMDENQGLGFNNQLLCHLPADLKYFKAQTLGKTIIMGRNTFDSIGKVLPGRKNIIISRQKDLQIDGAVVCHTVEQALAQSDSEETMILGGASLYEQTIELAHTLYITKIHHAFEADVFFPTFDLNQWQLVSTTMHQKDDKNKYDYDFLMYKRGNE